VAGRRGGRRSHPSSRGGGVSSEEGTVGRKAHRAAGQDVGGQTGGVPQAGNRLRVKSRGWTKSGMIRLPVFESFLFES
jgi:hypothetical protein